MTDYIVTEAVKEMMRRKYPIPEGQTANAKLYGVDVYISNLSELVNGAVFTPPPLPMPAGGWLDGNIPVAKVIRPEQDSEAPQSVGDFLAKHTDDVVSGMIAIMHIYSIVDSWMPVHSDGTAEATRGHIWALQTELGELSNELAIKQWRPARDMTNQEKTNALKELADVMLFTMAVIHNVARRAGLDWETYSNALANQYMKMAEAAIHRHSTIK